MIRTSIIAFSLLAFAPNAAAKTPSDAKVSKDVTRYWKKAWPEQDVAHVARKTECEKTELELPSKVLGKTRKVKTCQLNADVYINVGYRYHIYRACQIHYRGSRLLKVIRGEMEKVWKAGGVPAPDAEQAQKMLEELAKARLGAEVQIAIVETGKPRIYGETFRLTYVVNATLPGPEGKAEDRKGLMVTFESDGGEWKAVEGLVF